MIIWGTRGINSVRSTGHFECPRCGPNRAYRHYAVGRWFTLYFIPIIPLGTAGEYVECQSCAATWGKEILENSQDLTEVNIENARLMLILASARAGVADSERIHRLQTQLSFITSAPIDLDDLKADLARASRSPARLQDFAGGCTDLLPDAGKRDIVQRTAQVLVQGNRIGQVEQQVLLELGQGLGFRQDEIRRISTEAPNGSGGLL